MVRHGFLLDSTTRIVIPLPLSVSPSCQDPLHSSISTFISPTAPSTSSGRHKIGNGGGIMTRPMRNSVLHVYSLSMQAMYIPCDLKEVRRERKLDMTDLLLMGYTLIAAHTVLLGKPWTSEICIRPSNQYHSTSQVCETQYLQVSTSMLALTIAGASKLTVGQPPTILIVLEAFSRTEYGPPFCPKTLLVASILDSRTHLSPSSSLSLYSHRQSLRKPPNHLRSILCRCFSSQTQLPDLEMPPTE